MRGGAFSIVTVNARASRTVLDEEMPYHPLGLPQSWYPPADTAALGIDLAVLEAR